jgi:hypothetical protein
MAWKSLAGLVLMVAVTGTAGADECVNWQAEHPAWVFCDDFENSSTDDYDGGWREYVEYVQRAQQPQNVLWGDRAIQATITPGVNSAASVYKYFPGQDGAVYARWYAKFASDYYDQGRQHFVTLQGLDTTKPCGCPGCCANERPNGDDRFLSGLEFIDEQDRMRSFLYSYFYNQRNPSSTYRCCPKPLSRWAKTYEPDPAHTISKDRWYCMELMVQPNTPGSDDGRQSFWIDGVPVLSVLEAREPCGPFTDPPYSSECEEDDPTVDVFPNFYQNPPPYTDVYPAEGFVWRTTSDLKLNNVWVQVYNHEAATNPGQNRVWFDGLVVSTAYIGPVPCPDAGPIQAACTCGGPPDPADPSNVHTTGYCCNGVWQGQECGPVDSMPPAAPTDLQAS